MTTARDLYLAGRERLTHIDNGDSDARALVLHALDITLAQYTIRDIAVAPEQVIRYLALVERRAMHEPLQYIMGHCEFYGLRFHVTPDVLIPRPETECLVERVIELSPRRMLDIGTGSGAIALSVATTVPQCRITALDVSGAALDVARRNAAEFGVNNVEFIEADILRYSPRYDMYDVVVSNPPYIETACIDTLMEEVRLHEPRLALDGGDDGLAFYRRIMGQCVDGKAILLFEMGYTQYEPLTQLAERLGYTWHVYYDYGQIPRVMELHPMRSSVMD